MRSAQWVWRDPEQAVERSVHLQDEEYGARDGQRAHDENRDDEHVPRSEQPKAREGQREPEQEHHEERDWNRRPGDDDREPSSSQQGFRQLQRTELKRPLDLVARAQRSDRVGESLGPYCGLCAYRIKPDRPEEPDPQIISIRAPTARCRPLRISPVSGP